MRGGTALFSFRCEWIGDPEAQMRSGLELGHMTFTGSRGECTSSGSPRQAMMMGPSLDTLLYEMGRLLTREQLGSNFSAVGSSFAVSFQRVRRGAIEIRCQKTFVGEVDDAELHAAILSGIEAFLPREGSELTDDVGRADLLNSLPRFKRLVELYTP